MSDRIKEHIGICEFCELIIPLIQDSEAKEKTSEDPEEVKSITEILKNAKVKVRDALP
jgi:hypothetical protein